MFIYSIDVDQTSGETTISVSMYDALNKLSTGNTIIISYDAMINDGAVEKNGNDVTLTYSNDPSDNTSTTTKTVEADVYTYYLQILKVNKDSETVGLTNVTAEFELYILRDGETDTTDPDNYDIVYFIKDADGEYTVAEDPTDPDAVTTVAVATGTGVEAKLILNGLESNYYYIKEITAPDGYQLPTEDFFFELHVAYSSTGEISVIGIRNVNPIGAGGNGTAGIVAYGGTVDSTQVDSHAYFSVLNIEGSALPTTGGMGTTLFIIGGIILMALAAAAVVLLVKDKKKA